MAGPSADDLFTRHHRDVYRFLYRMTGSRDAASDLAQDVFLKVVTALSNGGPVGHERGWIFAIARNLLIDRQRGRSRALPLADQPAEPAKDGSQALAVGLSQALGRLADNDREIFLLKEVGGLSYQEIAAACDCTVESVRSRLYRARSALRFILSM